MVSLGGQSDRFIAVGTLKLESRESCLEIPRNALANIYWEEGSFDLLMTDPAPWLDLKDLIPKVDYQVTLPAPRMGTYKLMLEVNCSYDFNEYYSKPAFQMMRCTAARGRPASPL